MKHEIVKVEPRELATTGRGCRLPAIVQDAGKPAVFAYVKRRFKAAGLPTDVLKCYTFRATTITDLLNQGVSLEDVQHIAGHADPRTTRLYDRRKREVTRNIVEWISF